MEGVGEGFKKVKDGLVELEEPAEKEAHEGGAAHDGEDAKGDAYGDRP